MGAKVTRPTIGITIAYDQRRSGYFTLRHDYVRCVEKAGGLPTVLAPGRPEDAPEILDRLAGLLLSGGSDVDPELYGEPRHPRLGPVVRERDDFELALCREALRRDLPMLAVCRGHQVLNVARGGTLLQDIPSDLTGAVDHDRDTDRWERAHEVSIVPGTRLHAVLGMDRIVVNSFHHQAVKDVGDGLVVSARSDDGVVEAIEARGRRFAVGVQWHPEAYWQHGEDFAPLFKALVAPGGGR